MSGAPLNNFFFSIDGGENWISNITEVTANGATLTGVRVPFDVPPVGISDYVFGPYVAADADYFVHFIPEGYLSKLAPHTQTVLFNIKATGYSDKEIVVNLNL